ncbi:hypothetical protein Ahy_B06g081723 isoform I [Arachis hypogaea]|uniref:Uncharacterized protein n=1 Tax=Arachis hypogaea TaxID=3818 RepID=A0A444YM09_ARAHY|nr:hypothetical protein Ahy_B06g081723 isoform I [Arachis hypogaea]
MCSLECSILHTMNSTCIIDQLILQSYAKQELELFEIPRGQGRSGEDIIRLEISIPFLIQIQHEGV